MTNAPPSSRPHDREFLLCAAIGGALALLGFGCLAYLLLDWLSERLCVEQFVGAALVVGGVGMVAGAFARLAAGPRRLSQ